VDKFGTMKKWMLFSCFFIFSWRLYAQTYEFINYSEIGLIPTQSVAKIHLDQKGYLWITGNKGLYKIRGRHSKFYTASDGLPLDFIANISAYEDNQLVVNCFDPSFKSELVVMNLDQPGKFKPFLKDFSDVYGNEFITRVYKDSKETIWINTRRGFYHKKKEDSIYQKIYPDTTDNAINFEVIDDWAIINNQGDPYITNFNVSSPFIQVRISEQNKIRTYQLPIVSKILKLNEERRCLRLANGDIVYVVSNILYLLKKDLSVQYKELSYPVLHLFEDSKKGLWIGLEKGLLHIENLKYLNEIDDYIPGKLINAICEDKDGGIWIGSTESGIYHSPGKGLKRLLNSNIVAIDTAFNKLYVSDRKGFVTNYELDSNNNLYPKYQYDNKYPNFVLSIRPIRNFIVITDLYGKTKVLDSTLHETGKLISDNSILGAEYKALLTGTFLIDHTGEMIIHSEDSLHYVKAKKSIKLPQSLRGINSIQEDLNKNIIFGTDSGLFVLSKQAFYQPGKLFPILNDRILNLQCDYLNRYWILFRHHGLVVMDSTGFIFLSKQMGLDPGSIRDIDLSDSTAWISTLDGLFRTNISKSKLKKFEFIHYGYENGLLGDEVYGVSLNNNNLYVNAKLGLFYASLNELKPINRSARLDIFTQDGKVVTDEIIRFESDIRKIVFRIETTSYQYFRHPKYYYTINQSEQTVLENADEITLQDMKSGNYEITIRSAYDFENRSARTIRFSIDKPIWARPWFIALAILIIGSSISYFLYKRISSIRKKANEQIKLENLISEYKIKSLQAQMNPHFLFNMLNTIYSMSIIKSDKTPDVIMRLSALLRFMLYEIEKEWIPIETEINIIKEFIALQLFRFENKVKVTQNYSEIEEQKLIKPLLMFPLIENAFKHGIGIKSDKSFIHIDIKLVDDNLMLRTENKIMKEENNLSDSSGLGLSNIKKQLQLIYTDFDLQTSELNDTFIVTLFINLKSYDTTSLPNR